MRIHFMEFLCYREIDCILLQISVVPFNFSAIKLHTSVKAHKNKYTSEYAFLSPDDVKCLDIRILEVLWTGNFQKSFMTEKQIN